MKASTLFLGLTLVVLAAALAGLWQSFGPRSAPPTPAALLPSPAEAPAVRPKPMEPTLAEPAEPGVRSVYPGGRPTAAPRPVSPESAPPPVTAQQQMPEPAPTPAPVETPPAPERSAALPPVDLDSPAEAPPAEAPGDAVDLNTAPLEELNGLGAGMIGKTIIANRPYETPDDLITRRVLKRQDFDVIKPRITVR